MRCNPLTRASTNPDEMGLSVVRKFPGFDRAEAHPFVLGDEGSTRKVTARLRRNPALRSPLRRHAIPMGRDGEPQMGGNPRKAGNQLGSDLTFSEMREWGHLKKEKVVSNQINPNILTMIHLGPGYFCDPALQRALDAPVVAPVVDSFG